MRVPRLVSTPSALVLVTTLFALFPNHIATAQTQTTPFQIAGEVSGLGLYRNDTNNDTGALGIGVRTEFTLAPGVEIETRVTWFPAHAVRNIQGQGGRTLQAAAGIRGQLWTSHRLSLYALLLPGVIHFTDTYSASPNQTRGGATHFSLDTGGGLEWYASDRWTARVELTGPVYAASGGTLVRECRSADSCLVVNALGRFVNPWQISTGVGYRMGSPRPISSPQSVAGRWEIGGEFAQTTAFDGYPFATDFQQIRSGGVFASYRVARAIYADAAVRTSFGTVATATPFEGGHLLQALGGAKIGMRRNSYGIFAKVRGGVNSYSGAFESGDTTTRVITTRRSNLPALDVGVVVERYLSDRWLVRFDGSDVLSFYSPTAITVNGRTLSYGMSSRADTLQWTMGVGWRF